MNKIRLINILLVIYLILFSFACTKEKPQLTIEEDKLIKVFFDLHSADYIVNRASTNEKDSLAKVYIDQIFKIHNIEKNEFEKNLNELKNHPKYFKEFYKKLSTYSDSLIKVKNSEIKRK